MHKLVKRIVIAVLVALSLLNINVKQVNAQTNTNSNRVLVDIVRVTDGDTIVVKENDKIYPVRFSCIDAPEIHHSNAQLNSVDPFYINQLKWGAAAKYSLTTITLLNNNQLYIDKISQDRYGRTVASVYTSLGETYSQVQSILLSLGVVQLYYKYKNTCKEFSNIEVIEKNSIEKKIGVWGDVKYITPWEWRTQEKLY